MHVQIAWALDRSMDSSSIVTKGKMEYMITDEERLGNLVVVGYGNLLLIMFSQ